MIAINSRTCTGSKHYGPFLIGLFVCVTIACFSSVAFSQQTTTEQQTTQQTTNENQVTTEQQTTNENQVTTEQQTTTENQDTTSQQTANEQQPATVLLAPVELKSKDGLLSIAGNLISFDGEFYEVQTEIIGKIRLSVDSVDCEGLACPVVIEYGPEFGIYGSRTVGTTLIPNLLRGYARSIDATFEIDSTDQPTDRTVRLINADGTLRAEIDLKTPGSASAFPALADGIAAIGLADRRMNDDDLEKLTAADIPDLRDTENEIVLGVDGIAIITHQDNPVSNLSALDIARIWSGEVTNWLEFGGGDIPISVNTYSEDSGDRAVMLNALVRPNNSDETAEVTRWSAYQDLVDAVMADRGGIGYVGRWLARTNEVNILDIREECGLLSPPTDFRMKIESYVLSRRLYAYTKPGRIHPEAKAFLDWALTSEAQVYIKESHFVADVLERMRLEDMGMELVHTAAVELGFDGAQYVDMIRQLRGADRLSVSFRFNIGSSVLDVESVRNIDELANRMIAGEFDGLEVLLVGFTDSEGGRLRNTSIARARATAVQEILTAALDAATLDRLALIPLSFGELLPLSCNDSEVGRTRNRRVEVWLRVPDSR